MVLGDTQYGFLHFAFKDRKIKRNIFAKNIQEFHQFPEGLSSTFDIQITFL